jgi:ribosomal protein L31
MQKFAHPRRFSQIVKLTDGSTTKMSSFSPSKPYLALNVDSLSHPSWNPALLNSLRLSEHGQVARFKGRYQDSSYSETSLDELAGLMNGCVSPPPRLIKHP